MRGGDCCNNPSCPPSRLQARGGKEQITLKDIQYKMGNKD